jgi:hypothetical protein
MVIPLNWIALSVFPGFGQSGSTVYCGLDIVTGEMVALSEWTFKSQVAQKRSANGKSKIEDEKLSKQVITFTILLELTACFVSRLYWPLSCRRWWLFDSFGFGGNLYTRKNLTTYQQDVFATGLWHACQQVLSNFIGLQHRTRNKLINNASQSP